MSNDIQFQIECLASELANMLIEEYGWDIRLCTYLHVSAPKS